MRVCPTIHKHRHKSLQVHARMPACMHLRLFPPSMYSCTQHCSLGISSTEEPDISIHVGSLASALVLCDLQTFGNCSLGFRVAQSRYELQSLEPKVVSETLNPLNPKPSTLSSKLNPKPSTIGALVAGCGF